MTMEGTTRWRWVVGVIVGLICVMGVAGCDLEEPDKVVPTPAVVEVWATPTVDMLSARERFEAGGELSYEEIEALRLAIVGRPPEGATLGYGAEYDKAKQDFKDSEIEFAAQLAQCRLKESIGWILDWYQDYDDKYKRISDSNVVRVLMYDPYHGFSKEQRFIPHIEILELSNKQIEELKYGQRVRFTGKLLLNRRQESVKDANMTLLEDDFVLGEEDVQQLSSLYVRLDRSICYGNCPNYRLDVKPNGSVTFEGRSHTSTKGVVNSTIDQDQIQKLAREILKADFFNMEKPNVPHDGDLPTYTLSVAIAGKVHQVKMQTYLPHFLLLLDRIDQIVGTEQWIGDGR